MNSKSAPLRCVLVAEADHFCLPVVLALTKSGVEIIEVWCEEPEKYETPNLWRSVTSSKERKFRHTVTKQLNKHNSKIVGISRPFLKNLTDAKLNSGGFDFLICAGSGIIFPEKFLNQLKGKAFNLHPALLPAYRGPKPLHAMMLHGTEDIYGGLTLHLLSKGIDEGDIVAQSPIPLNNRLHSDWSKAVIEESGTLINDALLPFLRGEIQAKPQSQNKASYFSNEDIPDCISADMTFAQALNFTKKAPLFTRKTIVQYLDNSNVNRSVRIHGEPVKIGAALSIAPKKTLNKLQMDLLDCRVEFKINHRLQRYIKKLVKK